MESSFINKVLADFIEKHFNFTKEFLLLSQSAHHHLLIKFSSTNLSENFSALLLYIIFYYTLFLIFSEHCVALVKLKMCVLKQHSFTVNTGLTLSPHCYGLSVSEQLPVSIVLLVEFNDF